jgi:hypothetical protein
MIDPLNYTPRGDKKNSDFFNEYRMKIYQRRISSGLEQMFGDINGIVIQVENGDAIAYLKELYFMTPYRYYKSFINSTHKIYCLINTSDTPVYIILEPLNKDYKDDFTRINHLYPNAREKANARYIGEIFFSKDHLETKKILLDQSFNFMNPDCVENKFYANPLMSFMCMSDFTRNSLAYTSTDLHNIEQFNFGQEFTLTKKEQEELDKAHQWSVQSGVKQLLKGVDHLATRILSGEREDAILEFLCLSGYYFWGSYDIQDMNSSTNVTRTTHEHDIKSPAKVFTANNTPFMVNTFKNLPMPTETFVRNYGRRLHHIAIEVTDGDHGKDGKNIDFVINTLQKSQNIPFLAQIFGECQDQPDLKQIFSKHSPYSILITEYVERCHNFDGFFAKGNVAALTAAAGLDETVASVHKNMGLKAIVGD